MAEEALYQAGQESMEAEHYGANGAHEGEPGNTENINYEEQIQTVEDDQSPRVFSPSSVASIPAVTVSIDESRSSSRASSRMPRTVGGFLADDSDDEDQAAPTPTSLQVAPTPRRTVSPSPLVNSVTSAEVRGDPSEAQGDLGTGGVSVIVPVTSGSSSITITPANIAPAAIPSIPKARLPHDKVGILEDRIAEDPRGDIPGWFSLIAEHRSRHKLDEARLVFERFLQVFPQAAEVWVQYVEMELEHDNFDAVETIFSRSLMTVPNVQLWTIYLNYVRRVNDLTDDATGNKRTTVLHSYEFVLNNVGIDKDSGWIWQEYIQFIRNSTPGVLGGNTWQDQQKLDILRKAYQRAICVPMAAVTQMWKEYDQFEQATNKMTARKYTQEKSPLYMTARSANTQLDNITRGLIRTTLPKLPPANGFDGSLEYMQQVAIWKSWISLEITEDPVVLKQDVPDNYKKRILYVYKQAVMALRFWPEIWVDAADWCYENGMAKDGDDFLASGIAANPESCLLAFKHADRLELTVIADANKGLDEKGAAVRAPFDKVLDALYDLIKHLKGREAKELAKLDESAALDATISAITGDEGDEETEAEKAVREASKKRDQDVIKDKYKAEAKEIQSTISYTWIALMRAMRRIQGKGAVKSTVGGSRKIFADARARGKILSDVYVASALLEHHVYKDVAGTKIFERGSKLFPEDAPFILEYLKHLLSIGDTTNARVAFETSVSRLTAKEDLIPAAKPLYSYFHKYESQYGELSQIQKLEKRMAELYPNDPKLSQFAARYSSDTFDPTSFRPIVSPATQLRKMGPNVIQSIEAPQDINHGPHYMQEISPRPQFLLPHSTNSPKRPLTIDAIQDELNHPRKLARAQSPLKGAAGRRLEQQQRLQQQQGGPQWQPSAPPFVVPRDITFLMSIIPRADLYNATRLNPEAMVKLLGNTFVPDYTNWKAQQAQPVAQGSQYHR